MDIPDGERLPLTESQFLAWAERSQRAFADELNSRFADLLPEDTRFEWTADPE